MKRKHIGMTSRSFNQPTLVVSGGNGTQHSTVGRLDACRTISFTWHEISFATRTGQWQKHERVEHRTPHVVIACVRFVCLTDFSFG